MVDGRNKNRESRKFYSLWNANIEHEKVELARSDPDRDIANGLVAEKLRYEAAHLTCLRIIDNNI